MALKLGTAGRGDQPNFPIPAVKQRYYQAGVVLRLNTLWYPLLCTWLTSLIGSPGSLLQTSMSDKPGSDIFEMSEVVTRSKASTRTGHQAKAGTLPETIFKPPTSDSGFCWSEMGVKTMYFFRSPTH